MLQQLGETGTNDLFFSIIVFFSPPQALRKGAGNDRCFEKEVSLLMEDTNAITVVMCLLDGTVKAEFKT